MQNKTKAIIAEIARKYGKNPSVVQKVVTAPFKLNAKLINDHDLMNDDNTPVFYHPNLGYFSFSDKKITRKRKRNGKDS